MRAPTFPKYLPSTVDDPKALPNTNSQLPRACRPTAMQSGPVECAKRLNNCYTYIYIYIYIYNNLIYMCLDDMARPWGHKAPWGGLNTRKQLRDEHSNPAQVEGPLGPPRALGPIGRAC